MSKKLAKTLAANISNNITVTKALAFIREQEYAHAQRSAAVKNQGMVVCKWDDQVVWVSGKDALQVLKNDLQECRQAWGKGIMVENNRNWEGRLLAPEGGYSPYIFPRSGCPKRIAEMYAR